jgi:hypothetical protein
MVLALAPVLAGQTAWAAGAADPRGMERGCHALSLSAKAPVELGAINGGEVICLELPKTAHESVTAAVIARGPTPSVRVRIEAMEHPSSLPGAEYTSAPASVGHAELPLPAGTAVVRLSTLAAASEVVEIEVALFEVNKKLHLMIVASRLP